MARAVNARDVLGLVRETRAAVHAVRYEPPTHTAGSVGVSGMLAEQLVRELGAGSEPGAVRAGGDSPSPGAEVLVRIIAGEPTDADLGLVSAADASGVPVVLVQLWPQADWTRPFVLSPFVVECRAGEGFPVREIADRIVDASAHGALLAARVPILRPSAERKAVHAAVLRTALLGAFVRTQAARPLLTLEQLRMVARLTAAGEGGSRIRDEPAALGSVLGVAIASGFALRGVARTARFVLPAPVANAAVAAAGTWALARAARAYGARAAR